MTKWVMGIAGGLVTVAVLGGIADHVRLARIEDRLNENAARDKQIELLWRSEVAQYNNLNATRAALRMSTFPWPDLK